MLDTKKITVDMTITPENCESKGFEWQHDTYYSLEAPDEVNQQHVDLSLDGGLLGEAASRTLGDDWYGLYYRKDNS